MLLFICVGIIYKQGMLEKLSNQSSTQYGLIFYIHVFVVTNTNQPFNANGRNNNHRDTNWHHKYHTTDKSKHRGIFQDTIICPCIDS